MIKTWTTGGTQHWGRFVYNARILAAIPKKKRKEPPTSSDEPALGAPEELELVPVLLGLPPDVVFAEFPLVDAEPASLVAGATPEASLPG